MNEDGTATAGSRIMVELSRAEALELLAGVNLGRIVFTRNALPAIRPVNHALIDGQLVIRTHADAAVLAAVGGEGAVVAYEADLIDPATHLGWSVVVTGFASVVRDLARLARYQAAPTPWVNRAMEQAVVVRLDMVTGYRLSAAPDGAR